MPTTDANAGRRAQIALEFMIVYSFVLLIFVLLFTLIATQRGATLAQQEYSLLQLQTQSIASYINQALAAGNGYSATIPFSGSINAKPYALSVSTSGVIIAQMTVGTQIIRAYAFSNARNMVVNGTPTQSGNGITVYSVPTQSGSLYLTNSQGVIYFNAHPSSTVGLAKSITSSEVANVKDAGFNGASSYISVLAYPIANLPAYTVDMWVYLTSGTSYLFAGYTSSVGSPGCASYYISANPVTIGTWNQNYAGNWYTSTSSTSVPLNSWHMVTVTLSGGGTGTGNIIVYLDGGSANIISGQSISSSVPNPLTEIGGWATGCTGSLTGSLNGAMADVQVYNSALTSNQVASLYSEGIGGSPVVPANVIGWWQLNGNANDYSGSNNNGATTSVVYQSVAQMRVHIAAGNGANAIGTPIGFVTSAGSVGPAGYSNSIALYANAAGNQTVFVSSSGAVRISNLTINVFNDNLTTVGNLLGWWPLDEGYGSTVYDLSTHYNNGLFSSPSWAPFSNQTTNLAAANFNGASSYIQTSASALPMGTNALSMFAWIKTTQSGNYPDIAAYGKCGPGNGAALGVYAGYFYADFCSDAANSNVLVSNGFWHLVGFTFAGGTKAVTMYVDGVAIPGSVSTVPNIITGGYNDYIGWWSGATSPYFQGSVSDVQIYNISLSSSQVKQLYQEGVSGQPMGDSGLVGWWPLADSANDYSSNGNNGVPTNVVFGNVNYVSPATSGAMKVASFNGGSSSYVSATAPVSGLTTLTSSLWVNLAQLGVQQHFLFMGANGGNRLAPYITTSNIFHCYTPSTDLSSGYALSSGTWYFLTCSYTGSSIYAYVNGVLEANAPLSSFSLGGSSIFIGSDYQGSFPTNGLISDVQIYSPALPANQIMQMYQQGLPPYSKLNVSLG
jgi:hypothetical protein